MNITMKVYSDGQVTKIEFPGLQEETFNSVEKVILGQQKLHFSELQVPDTREESFSLNEEVPFLQKSEVKEKLLVEICLDEPSLPPGLTEEETTRFKKEYKESAISLFGALQRYISMSDTIANDLISIEYQSPYTTSHSSRVSQVSIFKPYDSNQYDQTLIFSSYPDLPPF